MSQRTEIRSNGAPAPIGPYSQAVAFGDLVFCSGQVALDPETGLLMGDGDVAVEADRCLDSLEAVLAAGGAGLAHVVKATIYLTDMGDFATVNDVYGRRLEAAGCRPAPARATVQVSGLPKGARVEIDAVAVRAHED